TQFCQAETWVFPLTCGQKSLCLKAKEAASVRDDTSSLTKMLLTCLSTVRSLMNSAWAIALFDFPSVIKCNTSFSRRERSLPEWDTSAEKCRSRESTSGM